MSADPKRKEQGGRSPIRPSAVIYSIPETCRKLGIDQQEYFHDVLTRLPTAAQ